MQVEYGYLENQQSTMKLSILMPVYNEENTIIEILNRVKSAKLINDIQKEIIIVDDYSQDKTVELIKQYQETNPDLEIKLFHQDRNYGKGAAIRDCIKYAEGDLMVVQDADLEYDPDEYNLLINPILKHGADVVYGSRFVGSKPHRVLNIFNFLGNKFLTLLSNVFTNLNLTDMETCYKMFRKEIIKSIEIKENRFGFEPEITAKIAKIPKIKIYEVGISYHGRTYDEGKKISWKDGVEAIFYIFKYNLFDTHKADQHPRLEAKTQKDFQEQNASEYSTT